MHEGEAANVPVRPLHVDPTGCMANRALPLDFLLHDRLAPRIGAVEVALPDHWYPQAELFAALMKRWGGRHRNLERLASLYRNVGVNARHVALPIEEYETLSSFGRANDAFIRVGTELGARAVKGALAARGLAPADVGAIFFTTVTGLAVPTIDARLVNVLGLRRDVRRTPLFGLGCVGGAAGLARAADWLRAYPDEVAVLLSVELCTLTLQDDFSVANLIASGLFGDGAAAVVVTGARTGRTGNGTGLAPRVVASKSAFFPDTERVMGWDIDEHGFRVVLSADVPDIVRTHMRAEVDAFLTEHGLSRGDIDQWVCHPGGPKVISAMEEALALPPDALDVTRRSLAEIGNLSSASVLHVLAETTRTRARAGDVGVLLAMGPGFCAEMVLLEW